MVRRGAAWALILLLVSVMSGGVGAQSNLLKNPGFEDGFVANYTETRSGEGFVRRRQGADYCKIHGGGDFCSTHYKSTFAGLRCSIAFLDTVEFTVWFLLLCLIVLLVFIFA